MGEGAAAEWRDVAFFFQLFVASLRYVFFFFLFGVIEFSTSSEIEARRFGAQRGCRIDDNYLRCCVCSFRIDVAEI